MKVLAILSFFVFSACSHKAAPAAVPVAVEKTRAVSTDERTQKSNMELEYKDLASVMKIVTLTVDGDQNGCPVKPDQLAPLGQSLRLSLDERFAVDKEKYLKRKSKERAKAFPADCTADCSCAAHSAFMDYLQQHDVKLKAMESKLADKFARQAEELGHNPQSCIEDQSWVCDSKLFKSLMTE